MTRLTLRALLQGASEEVLREVVLRWCGATDQQPPRQQLAAAAGAMEDERHVHARLSTLPRKLQDLLEVFLGEQGPIRTVAELFASHGKNFKSRFDLEASLAALQREGFAWPSKDKRWASHDAAVWVVPSELVECIVQARRRCCNLL